MKYKKLISIMSIVIVSLLTACGNSKDVENEEEVTSSANEYQEQQDEDKLIIEQLEDELDNATPESLYEFLEDNLDEVNDKKSKEKIINEYNTFIKDYVSSEDGFINSMTNSYFFIDKKTIKISNDEYLTDQTKEEIVKISNPVYIELSKQNLEMELLTDYKEKIKADKGISSIIQWMNENNIEFTPISNEFSGLIVLENDIVLEYNALKLRRIFKIVDDNGNVQDPQSILGNLANKIGKEEYERLENDEKNYGTPSLVDLDELPKEKEDKESIVKSDKPIELGMTTEEVLEIKGEPKTINRTRNVNGTKEQWVYHSSYLYFYDDVLTTIQD